MDIFDAFFYEQTIIIVCCFIAYYRNKNRGIVIEMRVVSRQSRPYSKKY